MFGVILSFLTGNSNLLYYFDTITITYYKHILLHIINYLQTYYYSYIIKHVYVYGI